MFLTKMETRAIRKHFHCSRPDPPDRHVPATETHHQNRYYDLND